MEIEWVTIRNLKPWAFMLFSFEEMKTRLVHVLFLLLYIPIPTATTITHPLINKHPYTASFSSFSPPLFLPRDLKMWFVTICRVDSVDEDGNLWRGFLCDYGCGV